MTSSATDILDYRSSASSSSGVLAKLEIDPAYHTDSDGNVESSVSPDATAHYLFHGEPGVVLKALADTIGGSYDIGGIVSCSDAYEVYFETTDTEVELPYYPSGPVDVEWDGLSGRLVGDADNPRKFKCSAAPRRCTIKYGYQATRCWHKLPGSVTVGADEQRDINLRAKYEYEEK